ncbi:ribonuclease III [Pelagibacteraceae bacterium]|nr:ribonuclease III [Pelagibacteraceae bacterium]
MIDSKKLKLFEKNINYKFLNNKLLIQALTHPSFYLENEKKISTNEFERFEFLGDRVLGLIIANLLFTRYKKFNEGDLSKKYSYLVQKKFLFKISQELQIENVLQYNFKKKNNKMLNSIFSDSVESLIGAIFIDGGYKSSSDFITKFWSKHLDIEVSKTLDPKTLLQEISQQLYKKLPEYKLINKKGPPHSPTFTVSVKVVNFNKINSKGSSIREAERNAAEIVLKKINEKKNIKN